MRGIEKTALFLNGLPEEASATLLKKLEPETASKVRVEMIRLKGTPKETLNRTVAEFLDAINTTEQRQPTKVAQAGRDANTFDREATDSGSYHPIPQTMESFTRGIDYLTTETNRSRVSQETSEDLVSSDREGAFGFLHELQPEQIRELLLFETPRIVAVLLTQLTPKTAGQILEQLTPQAQKDVVSILFELEEIDEEILGEIEAVLKERANNIFGKTKKNIGYDIARRILQSLDSGARRHLFEEKPTHKSVAEPIPPKRVFVFEDLKNLPDRGLREIFDAVDAKTALLSLVGAPPELIERVFGKPSPEQEQRMIRQYRSFGQIHQIDVEAARQRVLENFQPPS